MEIPRPQVEKIQYVRETQEQLVERVRAGGMTEAELEALTAALAEAREISEAKKALMAMSVPSEEFARLRAEAAKDALLDSFRVRESLQAEAGKDFDDPIRYWVLFLLENGHMDRNGDAVKAVPPLTPQQAEFLRREWRNHVRSYMPPVPFDID